MSKTIKYFSWVGSYDGAILYRGRWVRVNGLNWIDKSKWKRWQGSPSRYLEKILKSSPPMEATDLFPDLVV